MEPTQMHLLVNHIPILGIAFGLPLLALAFIPKFKSLALAAMLIFTAAAAATPAAFFTGENAEERVEHMAGSSERAMHTHEEAAEQFRNIALLLGLLSIAALATRSRHKDHPAVFGGLLAVGALAMALGANTGHTGGMIRRPELRAQPAASTSPKPLAPPANHGED